MQRNKNNPIFVWSVTNRNSNINYRLLNIPLAAGRRGARPHVSQATFLFYRPFSTTTIINIPIRHVGVCVRSPFAWWCWLAFVIPALFPCLLPFAFVMRAACTIKFSFGHVWHGHDICCHIYTENNKQNMFILFRE